jgi:hypothetical protein
MESSFDIYILGAKCQFWYLQNTWGAGFYFPLSCSGPSLSYDEYKRARKTMDEYLVYLNSIPVDFAGLSGEELLARYLQEEAAYGTKPRPEGAVER